MSMVKFQQLDTMGEALDWYLFLFDAVFLIAVIQQSVDDIVDYIYLK